MSIVSFSPASIGNVSVGFDSLGMAIDPLHPTGVPFGDRVIIVDSPHANHFESCGPYACQLPDHPGDNLIVRAANVFLEKLNQSSPGPAKFHMTLEKNLPIGSGLGSSSSSIVAALVALNHFFEQPFGTSQLLALAGVVEAENCGGQLHFDNLAPCLLGGMQMVVDQEPTPVTVPVPAFDDWHWLVAYPGISINTSTARKLLPASMDLETGLEYGRRLAGFVAASYANDAVLAARMLVDVIAEPFRKHLIPDFDQVKSYAERHGALAVGISGSGPTIFVVCDDLDTTKKIEQMMADSFVRSESGFTRICKTCTSGAVVTKSNG